MANDKHSENNNARKPLAGLHDGHRLRMYEKLDSQSLCDHEYLEVLLFNAVPRKNTNDLAHRLLFEFGSARGVFGASYERLLKVEGVGSAVASYLVCIGKFAPHLLSSLKTTFPRSFKPKEFGAYAKREYGNLTEEVLDVYLLGSDGNAMERKRCYSPEDGTVEVRAKWLQDVISASDPSGVILVHNHPMNNATPSKTDDLTTQKCQYLCDNAGILFCDHLIYGKDGLYSYFDSGELVRIAKNLNASPAIVRRAE